MRQYFDISADTFGYNDRGEVVFSRRGAESAEDAYSYDDIGNLTLAAFSNATNTYSANSLNQYTSLCDSASLRLNNCTYDLDGNMTQFADWSYSYDAANRLKTVSTNGVLVLTNFYDAKSRRVRKVTAEASTTFFYHPVLMRWLNRDPIGESGGANLYVFCCNTPVYGFEVLESLAHLPPLRLRVCILR